MTQHEAHSAATQHALTTEGPIQRKATLPNQESAPTTYSSASNTNLIRTTSKQPMASRQGSFNPARTNKLRRVLTANLTPARPVGKAPGLVSSMRAILVSSWLNILLLCIPISWALHFAWSKNTTNTQDTVIFVFSFLSIIPLAKLLAFATDELSMRVGQTLAGLLNATLGNAVELIVSILALIKCELQIVQSSLVGSILSNLLLVLGMCFFAGGLRFSEQGFGIGAVQIQSSLLILSVVAVLLPAAFHFVAGNDIPDSTEGREILSVSHGAAIILLFIYGCYLTFQLFSHTHLYSDDGSDDGKFHSTLYPKKQKKKDDAEKAAADQVEANRVETERVETERAESTALANRTATGLSSSSVPANGHARDLETGVPTDESHGEATVDEEEEEEKPQMSVNVTIAFLVIVTVLVAVTAEFLVDSIDGLTNTGHISKEFVGLILLPIVGNAAEHVTAVTVSVKDKLDLSLGVAVGSSIQIALFVIPFMVTLGWIIGKPLTLLFDPFESIVMFLSVIVVNYTVQDGKSNWLEGALLMCLYVILAVVFWYYPGVPQAFNLAGCPPPS
ncbi:Calcium/proton exchanger [Trametopsis cervina]|nr:Calcium/proton exchanger [Trametopsis cervina]